MQQEGLYTFEILSLILFIVLVISVVSMVFAYWVMIKRMIRLNSFIKQVTHCKDLSMRVEDQGMNEIVSLENSLNYMLESLDKKFIEIEKNDEWLHLLMEAANEGYFDYNSASGQVFMSTTWLQYLGYDSSESSVNFVKALHYIHKDDRTKFFDTAYASINNDNDVFCVEVRVNKAHRGYIWTLIRGKVLKLEKYCNAFRWIGSFTDITKRKETEQQNIYLMQTDSVTNLKNRTYMENIFKDIFHKKTDSFCILMADVNGLKLINDAFGHKEGDRLLSMVGDIFRVCCSDLDIPVRWGGDEFLILIRNNRQYADDILRKIQQEFSLIDNFPIQVNAAMGCAAYRESDISIDDVIKRAEEKMYHNKLLESRSTRNGVIASFEQTLHEKNIETHEHTERVKTLCMKIGLALNLQSEQMDDLALLSLLHDIGKISIPDDILTKTEEPTEEEWKQIRIHSESGYRIAKAIPEISHIAYSILYHHEKYDGTGYPTGISGEEIPLNARILAVVHDFDSMLYGTFYKKAIDIESTVDEIKMKSGTSFDAIIVKKLIDIIKN